MIFNEIENDLWIRETYKHLKINPFMHDFLFQAIKIPQLIYSAYILRKRILKNSIKLLCTIAKKKKKKKCS